MLLKSIDLLNDILPILVIALVHMGKKNFAPAVAVPGDISLADIDL